MSHHENDYDKDSAPQAAGIAGASLPHGMSGRRTLVPGAFMLAAVFFFFNFCGFSAGGVREATVKGIDLIRGTPLKSKDRSMPGFFAVAGYGPGTGWNMGFAEDGYPSSVVWALLAFAAAITGGVALGRERSHAALIGFTAGTFGTVSLLILKWGIRNQLAKPGGTLSTMDATFLVGYWTSLLAFLAATAISCLRLGAERNPQNSRARTVTPPSTTIHVSIISQYEDIPSQ